MNYDLYLSYSGRKTYLTCPYQYKLKYVDKNFQESNPKHVIFGSVIGKVFEWFYTKNVWASDDLVQSSLDLIEPAINDFCSDRNYDLSAHPGLDISLRTDLHKFIPSGIKTIQDNKLLSPNSMAEMKLHVTFADDDVSVRMGGYADFVHIDGDSVWIMDGKGSKYREKYVDPEQLIWYASQFYLKYHIAPTRLGFIHWRYPDDPIQWIEYDAQSIKSSVSITFDIARKILNRQFSPKTSRECKGCYYLSMCEEGKAYKSTISGRSVSSNIFHLDPA